MADLTVTAAQVALVDPLKAEIYPMIAAETIAAGQAVYRDSAGKAAVADADIAGKQQCRGVALNGGGAGQAIDVVRRGRVYGFTLTSQSYDDPIFLSNTAGALADAAGLVTVPLGVVEALSDDGSLTKVLFLDIRNREEWA